MIITHQHPQWNQEVCICWRDDEMLLTFQLLWEISSIHHECWRKHLQPSKHCPGAEKDCTPPFLDGPWPVRPHFWSYSIALQCGTSLIRLHAPFSVLIPFSDQNWDSLIRFEENKHKEWTGLVWLSVSLRKPTTHKIM